MALLLRTLPKSGLAASLAPAALLSARGFATGDPLKEDTRTTKSQQLAHETDEATKDSVSTRAGGGWLRRQASQHALREQRPPLTGGSPCPAADSPRGGGRVQGGCEGRGQHGDRRCQGRRLECQTDADSVKEMVTGKKLSEDTQAGPQAGKP